MTTDTSKVGHILSFTFGKKLVQRPIIAQYQKNGYTYYVTPVWNEASRGFIEYRNDSYFLEKGHISDLPMQLSEAHKAMSRAFTLKQECIAAKQAVNLIKAQGGAMSVLVSEPTTLPRRRFEMNDSVGFESVAQEGEFVEVDSEALQAAKDRYEALRSAFLEEMANAGIEVK